MSTTVLTSWPITVTAATVVLASLIVCIVRRCTNHRRRPIAVTSSDRAEVSITTPRLDGGRDAAMTVDSRVSSAGGQYIRQYFCILCPLKLCCRSSFATYRSIENYFHSAALNRGNSFVVWSDCDVVNGGLEFHLRINFLMRYSIGLCPVSSQSFESSKWCWQYILSWVPRVCCRNASCRIADCQTCRTNRSKAGDIMTPATSSISIDDVSDRCQSTMFTLPPSSSTVRSADSWSRKQWQPFKTST